MPRASKSGVKGLFRDGSGQWSIDLRWKDPATGQRKRHQEQLPAGITAAAAKQRAREILNGALAGDFDPHREAPRTVKASFDEYLKWCETDRPAYLSKRRAIVARLVAALGGDKRLDAVCALDVERFKKGRRGEGAANATVNRHLAVLRHAYGRFAAWGWVTEAMAKAVRAVPHLREPAERVRSLTSDEEGRLLGALGRSPGVRDLVLAGLLTGCRQGELIGLRKGAVDLDGQAITLTKTKSNRNRTVPINPALDTVLRDALARSPETSEFVFTSRRGVPYTGDGVRAVFFRAVKRAGLRDVRYHDLRHTAATRLHRAGVGLDVIAKILGHANLAVTQRYAHTDKSMLQQAMELLPAPVAPASPPQGSTRVACPLPANDTVASVSHSK